MEWTPEHIDQLLANPQLFLANPDCAAWVHAHGGWDHLAATLRDQPLPSHQQSILELLLAFPGETMIWYAQRLAMHRSTLYTHYRRLSDSLLSLFASGALDAAPAPPAQLAGPSTLPRYTTPLIGRASAADAISAALRTTRLLTLLGPGGIGKTRLASHLGGLLGPRYRDGVVFVDLAPLTSAELVLPAIARACAIPEPASGTLQATVLDALAPLQRLLILDNMEHVTAAAPLLALLRSHCPDLRMLITSRCPLHLDGGTDMPLEPLLLPPRSAKRTPDQIFAASAVQLLIARLRAATPALAVGAPEAPLLATICELVDGLPLAIELLAPWIRIFSLAELAGRLSDRLRLLVGDDRARPARQQSMRALLDWSCQLLSPAEQQVFRQCAVFGGSFTVAAAEAICHTDEGADVLLILRRLVDHNLLSSIRQEDGTVRLHMLTVIREYGLALLADDPAVMVRYAAHYLAGCDQWEARFKGPQRLEHLAWCRREHDNLRTILAWSLANAPVEAARLCGQLWRFWLPQGYAHEAESWIEQALPLAAQCPAPIRASLLNAAGALANHQGRYAQAQQHWEAAGAAYEEAGDRRAAAASLGNIGVSYLHRRDYSRAQSFYAASLAICREFAASWTLATALNNLAVVAVLQNQLEAAEPFYLESIAVYEQLGDHITARNTHGHMARYILLPRGEYAQARRILEDIVADQIRANLLLPDPILGLAVICLAQQDLTRARQLLQTALHMADSTQEQRCVLEALSLMGWLCLAEGAPETASVVLAYVDHARTSFVITQHPIREAWEIRARNEIEEQIGASGWQQAQAQAATMTALQIFELLGVETPLDAPPKKPSGA